MISIGRRRNDRICTVISAGGYDPDKAELHARSEGADGTYEREGFSALVDSFQGEIERLYVTRGGNNERRIYLSRVSKGLVCSVYSQC